MSTEESDKLLCKSGNVDCCLIDLQLNKCLDTVLWARAAVRNLSGAVTP